MKHHLIFLLIGLIIGATIIDYQTSLAEDYIVGSQDVLKITVYEHPDLTTITRVSEEGKITFPFIGELEVKKLSVQQIERLIAEKLSAGYVSNPQVTVFIEQYRSQKITVIGEVTKPGQYEITGPTSVLDVIAMALGLTDKADHTVILFRKDLEGGKDITYGRVSIDMGILFENGDFTYNVQLRDKDVIYVPKVNYFYIYGEVNHPGVYRLEKGLTVKRAISMAGGFTPKASKRKIEITRNQRGIDVIVAGNIDDSVEPDDVIMIKESLF